MESGPSRGSAAQKRPIITQAVIDQSDMYTHVLSSFTEKKVNMFFSNGSELKLWYYTKHCSRSRSSQLPIQKSIEEISVLSLEQRVPNPWPLQCSFWQKMLILIVWITHYFFLSLIIVNFCQPPCSRTQGKCTLFVFTNSFNFKKSHIHLLSSFNDNLVIFKKKVFLEDS